VKKERIGVGVIGLETVDTGVANFFFEGVGVIQ
jgi:hypothetical protein